MGRGDEINDEGKYYSCNRHPSMCLSARYPGSGGMRPCLPYDRRSAVPIDSPWTHFLSCRPGVSSHSDHYRERRQTIDTISFEFIAVVAITNEEITAKCG